MSALYLNTFITLIILLIILYVVIKIIKIILLKYPNLKTGLTKFTNTQDIQINSTTYIDTNNKIICISILDTKYWILIGSGGNIVIDQHKNHDSANTHINTNKNINTYNEDNNKKNLVANKL